MSTLALAPLSAQESNVDRLQAIQMCSEQAARVGPKLVEWTKGEMKKRSLDPSAPHMRVDFSAHFNAQLKRCLIEVRSTFSKGTILITSAIYDAHEGHLIGKAARLKQEKEAEFVYLNVEVFGKPTIEAEYISLMQK